MHDGLNDTTSVGRCGRFRDNAGDKSVGLNTCVVHGAMIFTFGQRGRPLGAPALGREVSVRERSASWTGCTTETLTDGRRFLTDLRTSLPGPMYTVSGTRWGFDWAVGSSPKTLEYLPRGAEVPAWKTLKDLPRLFLARGDGKRSVLVATSMRAGSLEIITHEHWWFTFPEPGARIMLVPLLDEDDVPRDAATAQLWLDLLQGPPVHCEERFLLEGDTLTIESSFTDAEGNAARLAPLPPVASLLGETCGLQSLPDATRLLKTVCGPYAALRGARTVRSVRMSWTRARIRATRRVSGDLSPLPEELAFAGDWTWNGKTPMDRLLSLRLWAMRAEWLPERMWAEVKRRTPLPTAREFRESLVRYTEPVIGRTWAKDGGLFAHCGEVSYDSDWYNGLTLSGLRRAGECADDALRDQARKLAAEIRSERREMVAYYEIFNDWALGAAWTDARGELFNLDCAHNGLEGILAEAALCEWEGDSEGRAFALYLAGRAAPVFVAAFDWAAYAESLEVTAVPVTEESFGVNHFLEWRGCDTIKASHRHFYAVAGDFPEFCALLRDFGPLEKLQRLADIYRRTYPERYKDWLAYGLGETRARELRAGAEQANVMQGKREQCAVFYHVSPDTALRLWVLGEDPDAMEGLYGEAMPLAAQILCRAGVELVTSGDSQQSRNPRDGACSQ